MTMQATAMYTCVLAMMLYQEAEALYRRLLAANKAHAAINVYLALVQYRCDNSDAALHLLAGYLHSNPLSLSAHNLKAAITCKLHGPQAAEQALRVGLGGCVSPVCCCSRTRG